MYDPCDTFFGVLGIFVEAQERHYAVTGTPEQQTDARLRARALHDSRHYDTRTPGEKKAYRDAHKARARQCRLARIARLGLTLGGRRPRT